MKTTANFVQLLTVGAVCSILGVSRPTVHALVQRGALTGLNPSDLYRGAGLPATAAPSPVAGPAPTAERQATGAIVR